MPKNLAHSLSAAEISQESLIDEYVSERVFKEKSPLCRVAMPYIMEEPE